MGVKNLKKNVCACVCVCIYIKQNFFAVYLKLNTTLYNIVQLYSNKILKIQSSKKKWTLEELKLESDQWEENNEFCLLDYNGFK